MLFKVTQRHIVSQYNIGLSTTHFDREQLNFYFNDLLTRFASDLSINPIYLEEIDFELMFTDVEFNDIVPDDVDLSFVNKYFYPIIFSDIKKNDIYKIDFKTKYAFTLDSSLVRYQSKSGVKYGEIVLGKKPVLYYIHTEIQPIIDILKSKQSSST